MAIFKKFYLKFYLGRNNFILFIQELTFLLKTEVQPKY
jgi:hypothetical protein